MKRNWPDHIAVGRTIHDGETPVTIVDIKAGPMMFNTADLQKSDVTLLGTLKMCVKYPDGRERWLPPTNGQQLVDWCEKQDAAGDAA